MNFNRFDFSNGNEIVGSMFAKCEMQSANFKGTELHETEFYQCDLRKADFRDAAGYKVDILGSTAARRESGLFFCGRGVYTGSSF